MDYKSTLNVTRGDKDPGAMPQRGNLPALEPRIQAKWEEIGLYRLSLEQPSPRGTFVLHDGPPYSNGDIHLGHALNKIAKDIIVKFRSMQGYRAPYVPGWDNHGMPIENEVSKEFRKKGERPDKLTLRKRCREYASHWVERQKAQFKRLGVRGDWEHPYLTMSAPFEAAIIEAFGQLAAKGAIYRGLKPVLWCAFCETALADAEVEYAEHTSNSIYVAFPVLEDPHRAVPAGVPNPAVVIWTTTPWTIPANLALAVHPEVEYAWVRSGANTWLVAANLMERTMHAIGRSDWERIGSALGSELVGLVGRHPLAGRPSPVVLANYVTIEDGTGIVHTAPGHGKEDFETGREQGLEVLCPVDTAGTLTAEAGEGLAGARILGGEADQRVIAALEEARSLLGRATLVHSYPHCWRCRNPLLFRATVQWFMSIDHANHRQRSLRAIEETRWYPPASKHRIASMVAGRPDWCLSRQRSWGVGIPAFFCKGCRKEILSEEAIRAVADQVRRSSADVWYERSASELLPAGFVCPFCKGADFEKETDILDVWFDSGSTHMAVLENREEWPELKWPADVYLEGSDQHRGWFNSSLMVSVGLRDRAPYEAVITNGWTLDEHGKAMHKSLGNAVSPNQVIETMGADILRLWVASTDYFEDVRCSDGILKQVSETYRRIRNTFRFLVNNLGDFDPAKDTVPDSELIDLDRWALARLGQVAAACEAGYEAYEFHRIYHAVHNFCTVDLSAFYLDVIKDRLYCSGAAWPERRAAQTALYELAVTLARILAPILSHTADEVWELLGNPLGVPSAQLASLPGGDPGRFPGLLERWEPALRAREDSNLAIEALRQEKTVGNSLEAEVTLRADPETCAILQELGAQLADVLKVSRATLEAAQEATPYLSVSAGVAPGGKCARCWLIRLDLGASAEHPELCARCVRAVNEFAGLEETF